MVDEAGSQWFLFKSKYINLIKMYLNTFLHIYYFAISWMTLSNAYIGLLVEKEIILFIKQYNLCHTLIYYYFFCYVFYYLFIIFF